MDRLWTYQQGHYLLAVDFGYDEGIAVETLAHHDNNGKIVIDHIKRIGFASDYNDKKIEEYKRLKLEREKEDE